MKKIILGKDYGWTLYRVLRSKEGITFQLGFEQEKSIQESTLATIDIKYAREVGTIYSAKIEGHPMKEQSKDFKKILGFINMVEKNKNLGIYYAPTEEQLEDLIRRFS